MSKESGNHQDSSSSLKRPKEVKVILKQRTVEDQAEIHTSLQRPHELSSLTKRTFQEHFNLNAAMSLIGNPRLIVDKNTRKINEKYLPALKQYVKENRNGKKCVKYKPSQDHPSGRLYGHVSLQNLPRRIRHTICGSLYHDIDVVNCHPVLLSQLCRKFNFSCVVLDEYIGDRVNILRCIAEECKVNPDEAKNLVIRLLNGGSYQTWATKYAVVALPSKYIARLIEEVKALQENFYTHFKNLQTRQLAKKPSPKASLLARVLNTLENEILQHMVAFEEKRYQRTVDVLVFDGCQIRREVDRLVTQQELDECSQWVFEQLGYQVKIIEKPMNDVYILPAIHEEGKQPQIGLHLTCQNEYEAAVALKKLHNSNTDDCLIKYCDGMLFVYDKQTGLWNSDEISIRAEFCHRYLFEMGDWLTVNCKWKKLFECLKVINIDADFLKRMELSAMGKVLFMNGYYDFETRTFSQQFDPTYFFPFRIERDYNALPAQEDVDFINKTLFVDAYKDIETGVFVKQKLSRAFAGTGLRDKSCVILIGFADSGKGVLTDALLSCGGKYMGNFDGGILVNQSGKDAILRNKEFLLNRYCRVLLSNELDPGTTICGTTLQKYTSGGDTQEGRLLFGQNIKFIPQFTLFINANDRPKIVPLNETDTGRVNSVDFPFQFTTKHTKEKEKLNFKAADETIKEKVKQARYTDALFHILAESYTSSKPIPSQSVVESSNEWNQDDDFLSGFLKQYQVTRNPADVVRNADILSWAKGQGFGISAVKIGLHILKLPGVTRDPKDRLRQYYGIKRIVENEIKKDEF